MSFSKKELKIGLGLGALVGALFSGVYGVGHYITRNYTDFGFTKCSTSVTLGREVGEDEFTIARNEPFRIKYACEDKDKLREICLYEDGELILGFHTDMDGFHGVKFHKQDNLGEHLYRLVAVDKKGNKREDTAKLFVEDRPYEEELILGISMAYGFNR